ncbi:MAG: lasso peptide biosynthesis PqqD family chaperone [Flammeovirgaceae bacterium]
MIEHQTILHRSPDVLHSALDNETIMMDIQTGEYHNLNNMGNTIWELLEEPLSFSDLCKALLEEYEVSEEVCQQETRHFLKELVDKKLISTQ